MQAGDGTQDLRDINWSSLATRMSAFSPHLPGRSMDLGASQHVALGRHSPISSLVLDRQHHNVVRSRSVSRPWPLHFLTRRTRELFFCAASLAVALETFSEQVGRVVRESPRFPSRNGSSSWASEVHGGYCFHFNIHLGVMTFQ
jgi:hypothetical protein